MDMQITTVEVLYCASLTALCIEKNTDMHIMSHHQNAERTAHDTKKKPTFDGYPENQTNAMNRMQRSKSQDASLS